MATLAFCSSIKEETGQTYSIAALATYLALEHNYKVLIMSTKFHEDAYETCFFEPNTIEELKEKINKDKKDMTDGIEGLAKAVMSNKTSPEIVTNYTKVIFSNNRLEVLGNMKGEDHTEYEKIKTVYKQIISMANKFYDFVFIDLQKGLDDELTQEILKNANIVVLNIPQKLKTIKKYVELRNSNILFQKNNLLLLIGRYDKNSVYTVKNIARLLNAKNDPCAIPYNINFVDSFNEGKLVDFFFKIRKMKKSDVYIDFFLKVRDVAQEIVNKLQELRMMG